MGKPMPELVRKNIMRSVVSVGYCLLSVITLPVASPPPLAVWLRRKGVSRRLANL